MQTIECSNFVSTHPLDALLVKLQAAESAFVSSSRDDLGSLEEQFQREAAQQLKERLQTAAQAKADATPPHCPKCGRKLSKRVQASVRIQTRYGPIEIKRVRGWCSKCKAWHCPADKVLNIESGRSPCVQEAAALLAAKMPVGEASAVLERLTGVSMPRSTLDRAAKQSGEKAQKHRKDKDAQARLGQGIQRLSPRAREGTLIIELDAWNIRERDGFGQTESLRAKGTPPERWHWVWTGTVFLLQDRAQTHGQRPIILNRGFVATRLGASELKEQLHAEALRRGLGQVERVVVIADGAIWIWNLASDRFPQAEQRLDFYHAAQHLWAVAEALHGAGSPEARAWMSPLLKQLKSGQALKVIRALEELLPVLDGPQSQVAGRELKYLQIHQNRLDYKQARRRGEPLGSGAIESTCRQYQCRFKRPGQFWTARGDEALLCLETYWRNGRWKELFPHARNFDPSQN
jgi:hypothetical protein